MADNLRSFYLMTYHGTFIVLDSDGKITRHLSLFVLPAHRDVSLLRVERQVGPDDVNASSFYTTIKVENLFLTAEPDGRITQHAYEQREWETLLLIPDDHLELLSQIIKNSWVINATNLIVHPRDIRFATGFLLKLGEHCLNIAENMPLTKLASVDQIVLPGSHGKLITARRLNAHAGAPKPKIWINPAASPVSRALQYIVAHGIKHHCPEAEIENIYLPEWGLYRPEPEPERRGSVRTGNNWSCIDIMGLSDCLRRRVIDTLIIDSDVFNVNDHTSRNFVRALFLPAIGGEEAPGFGADDLVCSIRAGRGFQNMYEEHRNLPPSYYQFLSEVSGLNIVFFGDVRESQYTACLRDAVPTARFVQGKTFGYDFEMLRRSANVAAEINKFSWLAAWLSNASKIFLPIWGNFNPVVNSEHMLLPMDDHSYSFIFVPFSSAPDVDAKESYQSGDVPILLSDLSLMSSPELEAFMERARVNWPRQPRLSGFDPSFYCASYPDVANRLDQGYSSALEHYIKEGFSSGYKPLAFNGLSYIEAHPDAAMLIAQGVYANPLEHFLDIERRQADQQVMKRDNMAFFYGQR